VIYEWLIEMGMGNKSRLIEPIQNIYNRMGSSITQANSGHGKGGSSERQKSQEEYGYVSDKIEGIVGKPRFVRSNITNIEL
jgi:hypothetical protein